MKISIYDNFDDYDDLFYSQLQDRDYNSNGLLAQLPLDYNSKKIISIKNSLYTLLSRL